YDKVYRRDVLQRAWLSMPAEEGLRADRQSGSGWARQGSALGGEQEAVAGPPAEGARSGVREPGVGDREPAPLLGACVPLGGESAGHPAGSGPGSTKGRRT
ncbi:MAG TPA: hypothetical protein VFJ56_06835, partial [Nitrospira sp.]|nr:hypothetical protein [Nitrospira sp.]